MQTQELSIDRFCKRSWEQKLLNPLVGSSMLELGNKIMGKIVYKGIFESFGFRHVSVDLNGRNGALKLDLTKPLNLGTFDMVTNIGTSEHVSEDNLAGQIECWRNIVEAMHVGSVFVSITPLEGAQKWLRHGRWYPQEEFFVKLAKQNGMDAERIYADDNLVYARLRRVYACAFLMPASGMHRNPNTIRSQ